MHTHLHVLSKCVTCAKASKNITLEMLPILNFCKLSIKKPITANKLQHLLMRQSDLFLCAVCSRLLRHIKCPKASNNSKFGMIRIVSNFKCLYMDSGPI